MKKIAIMLLAALMLFAFVACDPDAEETKLSTVATPMTGTVSGTDPEFSVEASALQSDLKIAEDGKVSGTIKYYDGDALDPLGFTKNTNWFAAIKLEKELEEGEVFYVKGLLTTNYSKDTEWILELDEKTKETFEFKVGAAPESDSTEDIAAGFEAATALIKLDFSTATFADAPSTGNNG